MLLVFIIFTTVVILFATGAILGAPYLPTQSPSVEAALDLADLPAGASIVDLGSGDGEFAILAARRGYKVIGYEINPLLVWVARLRTRQYRHQVEIHWRDFWNVKLPKTEAVYAFLITRYMPKLEVKLNSELEQPTLIISHVFELPTTKVLRRNHNTFVYRLGKRL